jgi:hypothetical protein
VSHRRKLQTTFSLQATELADAFRNTMGKLQVGPHGYAPDLTAPEGPSTGGGVQALQHVRLVPPQPNMPTIVVGHVNQRERVAELRTFDHVDAICRERFKQGAPFEAGHYEQLVQSMQGFLASCGLQVAFAGLPRELAKRLAGVASIRPRGTSTTLFAAIAGGIVLAALLAATLVWFFKS